MFSALLLCLLSAAAQAQVAPKVARVLDSKGTTLVERSGQPPRLLGSGETLSERDVISVARDSWAILEFNDQTRITLRPNTVFRLDAYRDDAPESMLLGLTKGGLRVVTGLLGKRRPDAVRIRTATATIGIRGTEFDARLCADDCAVEERERPAPRPLLLPVARVVEINGAAFAGIRNVARQLVPGALVYEGDGVVSTTGSDILLGFTDGSRVLLSGRSVLRIRQFRFRQVSGDQAHLQLVMGKASVISGQIAHARSAAYRFDMPSGTILPMGTGWTATAPGCAGFFCSIDLKSMVENPESLRNVSRNEGFISGKQNLSTIAKVTETTPPVPTQAPPDTAPPPAPLGGDKQTVPANPPIVGGIPAGPDATVPMTLWYRLDQWRSELLGTASPSSAALGRPGDFSIESLPGQVDFTLGELRNLLESWRVNLQNWESGDLAPLPQGDALTFESLLTVLSSWEVILENSWGPSDWPRPELAALPSLENMFPPPAPVVKVTETTPPVPAQAPPDTAPPLAPLGGDTQTVPANPPIAGNIPAGPDTAVPWALVYLIDQWRTELLRQASPSSAVFGRPGDFSLDRNTAGLGMTLGQLKDLLESWRVNIENWESMDLHPPLPQGDALTFESLLFVLQNWRNKLSESWGPSAWGGANLVPLPSLEYMFPPQVGTAGRDAELVQAEQIARSLAASSDMEGSPYPSSLIDRLTTIAVTDGSILFRNERQQTTVNQGEMLAASRISALTPVELAGAIAAMRQMGGAAGNVMADSATEEGLYVWVRDGAVSVSKDDRTVDVPAGNAAVATKDKVELLDTVPGFLRFDQTPRPFPAMGDTRADAFRATDGSMLNMCSVR